MRDIDVLDIAFDIHANRRGKRTYDALLYGSDCKTDHIVPVPVDRGISRATTFEDLALEYWLPTSNDEYPHMVDLDHNKATIDALPGGRKLNATYVVIFCPKDNDKLHLNNLIGRLSRITDPKWRGSVLVVKQTSRGVTNVTEDDIPIINTVTRLVTDQMMLS